MRNQKEQFRKIIIQAVQQMKQHKQELNSIQMRLRRLENQPKDEPKLGQPASYIRKKTT